MTETTSFDAEMTRSETASYLRDIAEQLESERGAVHVPIGNKQVRLSPPDKIDSEATVTERSRRLRKDTEELELSFRWNPTKDTAESSTNGGREGER